MKTQLTVTFDHHFHATVDTIRTQIENLVYEYVEDNYTIERKVIE